MPIAFWDAPEVKEVAEPLIERHHSHLEGADIRYAFRSEPSKSKGKVALATVQRVAGLNAFLADGEEWADCTNLLTGEPLLNQDTGEILRKPVPNEPFFLVLVWHHVWKNMDFRQRQALIDHELCHIKENHKEDLALVGHDLEEFTAVVKRHGDWEPEIGRIVRAFEAHKVGQEEFAMESAA